MHELDNFAEWLGNADEFADTARKILANCNLLGETVSPNARLVRDYTQRGIVSKPERRGKEAIYSFSHLIEFVAARVLVADGWPLAKISEQFAHSSQPELLSLIPGNEAENSALSVARRLLGDNESPASSSSISEDDRRFQVERPMVHQEPSPSSSSTKFRRRVVRSTSMQSELRNAMRSLGLPDDTPAVEHLTLVAIAPWCQLLINNDRLSGITVDEAEEIGRAITAALLNPDIRKGAK